SLRGEGRKRALVPWTDFDVPGTMERGSETVRPLFVDCDRLFSGTRMIEPLSCPYCNALVVPPAGARAGERVPCARCGETFSLPSSFETADDGRSEVPARETSPVALPEVRRWPNALVAAIVVGSMMLLAALVLRFALLTKEDRRGNDIWLARPERVPLRFVLAMLTVLVSAGVTFVLIRRRTGVPGG